MPESYLANINWKQGNKQKKKSKLLKVETNESRPKHLELQKN